MFKFSGGNKVKRGHYWNFSTGETIRLQEDGILPGNDRDIYLRTNSEFLLLVIAPFLGLANAFFLPTVAIATLVMSVIGKVLDISGLVWFGASVRRGPFGAPFRRRPINSEKTT